MSTRFSWGGYFLRLLFAIFIVFATYNPLGYSLYHWIRAQAASSTSSEMWALLALCGIVVLVGWVIFIRATYRSLGPFGTVLAVAFFGALIWLVLSVIPIPEGNENLIVYLIQFGLAGVLSAGLSWSHVRRRLTGQFDVDETDM